MFNFTPSIQKINPTVSTNIELYVLRLDLMHPLVNGNKWFKLKYNLMAAKEQNFSTILTFGGAYSNHIFATAAAGNLLGFKTIGVIRGEETLPLNSTLSFAVEQGMQLLYLDRKTYRQKHTAALQAELTQRFGEVFIIPEGGCNLNGVRGCIEIILNHVNYNLFDTFCLACGTATTLTGIALALPPTKKVIGFPVLKGGEFLATDIQNLLQDYLSSGLPAPFSTAAPWELVCDYHFGGYAQVKEDLLLFCQEFKAENNIPLDYVYTGKMFYGLWNLIQQGKFSRGERILLIHTGGLQGNLNIEKCYKMQS